MKGEGQDVEVPARRVGADRDCDGLLATLSGLSPDEAVACESYYNERAVETPCSALVAGCERLRRLS